MDGPTLDEVRSAKVEIVRQLKNYQGFAGAGIGSREGRLVVRVNWRTLPPQMELPEHLGRVEITHHEVGDIKAQSSEK